MLRSKPTAFIAATALLMSACGGDDGGDEVAVGDYASDLCRAFTDWTESIRARQAELQAIESSAPAAESKEALAGFVDAAIEATDELAEDIRSAGTPDTENGDEAADALLRAAEGTKSELEGAAETVDDLPTDSQEAFAAATEKFTEEIRSSLEGVGEGLEDIDTPELDEALDEESACRGE